MAIAVILESYVFGPSGFWTMAPLRYTAKLDPFLSLDCAPTTSTLAQSKERKGSNFAIWQPWPYPTKIQRPFLLVSHLGLLWTERPTDYSATSANEIGAGNGH